MWGCTAIPIPYITLPKVFPTHVGVYLFGIAGERLKTSFPHACGGVPIGVNFCSTIQTFSPRMWGCTLGIVDPDAAYKVFPTHVGVYLKHDPTWGGSPGFPHACGGVPQKLLATFSAYKFSPRMWGCTARAGIA